MDLGPSLQRSGEPQHSHKLAPTPTCTSTVHACAHTHTDTCTLSRPCLYTFPHMCASTHVHTHTRTYEHTSACTHTHTHTRTHLEESKKSGCHSTMSWNPCRWLSPSITNIWNVPSTLYSNSFQQNTYWSKFDEKSAEQKRTVFSSLE